MATATTAEATGSAEKPAKTTAEKGGGAPEISMAKIAFSPTELSVKKGDTVTWTNKESVGHDVKKTGGPGPEFSSGASGGMQEGDTFKHNFNQAGTFEYVCTVHSNMSGSVVVK